MDVTLYVYDLSRGLARQLSRSFLGTQIDAVYHTAIVLDNIEYFFGQGVQTCLPGNTHHGQPMERIRLGQTELPLDVILEYLESLKTIYTAESYDLFLHNCNNFSNDFSMFLVGKGIPDHITSLPQTVLNTPFGQMLKPQLDQALRGVTQAPVAPLPQSKPITNGVAGRKTLVHTPTSLSALMPLLEQSLESCAVLFFTSQACPPCKICYQPFDNLASEFTGKATLIKIDISIARDIAAQYSIRATPTFITICRGEQLDQWSGADVVKLEANTRLLVQMAHPPHPHTQLRLPSLEREYKASIYSKVPPLEKLLAKLDPDVRNSPSIAALTTFITARTNTSTIANVAVPDLAQISQFLRDAVSQGTPSKVFPFIDLYRLALLDVRVSGYFAEEKHTSSVSHTLISRGSKLDVSAASYPLLLTTGQALANTFTSRLSLASLLDASDLHTFVSSCLLNTIYPNLRTVSANLIFNMTAAHHQQIVSAQKEQQDRSMQGSAIIELVVCILEGLNQELGLEAIAEKETVRLLLLSTGLLLYCAPQSTLDELKDILEAVEARSTIKKAGAIDGLANIVKDVVQVLP